MADLPPTEALPEQQRLSRWRPLRPRDAWPIVADSPTVGDGELRVGRVASVLTRQGVVRVLVRVVAVSREPASRGRHFLVGMDRRGRCRSYWASEVIRVETRGRAAASRRAINAAARVAL